MQGCMTQHVRLVCVGTRDMRVTMGLPLPLHDPLVQHCKGECTDNIVISRG